MFSAPAKQKLKCGKLLADWQQCFATELAAAGGSAEAVAKAAAKAARAAQAKVDADNAVTKSRMCSAK